MDFLRKNLYVFMFPNFAKLLFFMITILAKHRILEKNTSQGLGKTNPKPKGKIP